MPLVPDLAFTLSQRRRRHPGNHACSGYHSATASGAGEHVLVVRGAGPRRLSVRLQHHSTTPVTVGANCTAPPSTIRSNRTASLGTSTSANARRAAESRRRDAENQLKLLRNGDSTPAIPISTPTGTSPPRDSCPGTAFPGCPSRRTSRREDARCRVRSGQPSTASARFLAIAEFGPGALIYHEVPGTGSPDPGADGRRRCRHRRPAGCPSMRGLRVPPRPAARSRCVRTAERFCRHPGRT